MKIVTWDTRGLGDSSKRLLLKRFLKKVNPDIVLIQETKKDRIEGSFIKSLWSSKEVGCAFVEAKGKSGGLLTVWDDSKILVSSISKDEFSLSIKCQTINKKICWITNVYGPCDYQERRRLWAELSSLAEKLDDPWCIGGDFNSIRRRHERYPVGKATRDMNNFNKFIRLNNLLEIPLSNGQFTWSKEGDVVSKSLKMFLIIQGLQDKLEPCRSLSSYLSRSI
ncbi:uncharacterized protein LOC120069076 [Benincasa hispida]|uniref:uncharacterized protein LOC120069076 n=1 Tax=Benincasa hispida TaxID=102211 RepID=UPI00190158E7|nr:uncharacterized protein LOC120069076 [Benincasa hispida]